MHPHVENILKKISHIEMDMALHRQILVSIPSDHKDEMHTVIQTIADQKKQVQDLRLEIKRLDESAYNQILAIEKGTEEFKALARGKQFARVDTPDDTGTCRITLNDGTAVACLVAAQEENGNWMVLTRDGIVRQFPGGLVTQ